MKIYLFLFILSISIRYLFCDELKQDRIINTIKLMLNSLQSNIEKNLFSLDYIKYSIAFSNFRLLKPLEKDLIISKKEIDNEFVYEINDLIISFVVDLNIRFFNVDNELKDSDRFFETTFSSIIFSVKEDYIDLKKAIIDNVHLSANSKIGKLNYFRNFNLGKNCSYIEIQKAPKQIDNTNSTLMIIFEELFRQRFDIVKRKINLITYDVKNILSLARENKTCSINSIKDYNIGSIQLANIRISLNDLEINNKNDFITISNMFTKGTFYSLKYKSNINFNFTLGYLDSIIIGKKEMEFNFDRLLLIFDKYNDDNSHKGDLTQIIKIELYSYLNDLKTEYYKTII